MKPVKQGFSQKTYQTIVKSRRLKKIEPLSGVIKSIQHEFDVRNKGVKGCFY
jgi:hypothetical protein